jgi:hypothetical protein
LSACHYHIQKSCVSLYKNSREDYFTIRISGLKINNMNYSQGCSLVVDYLSAMTRPWVQSSAPQKEEKKE